VVYFPFFVVLFFAGFFFIFIPPAFSTTAGQKISPGRYSCLTEAPRALAAKQFPEK
jgi:hypothetical protein